MATERGQVTDAELAVLEQLWEAGPATIRDLTDRLYPDGGVAAYGTVQKLLERLGGKACVAREAHGRVHVYRAVVDRPQLIAMSLRATADKLAGGSLTPLLTQLVAADDLSADELRELRVMVDRMARERSGKEA